MMSSKIDILRHWWWSGRGMLPFEHGILVVDDASSCVARGVMSCKDVMQNATQVLVFLAWVKPSATIGTFELRDAKVNIAMSREKEINRIVKGDLLFATRFLATMMKFKVVQSKAIR
jgi:hypothetical protein